MHAFKVKITTRHEGCRRVCRIDVIADDWLAAGRMAVKLIKPSFNHWISVMPQSEFRSAK